MPQLNGSAGCSAGRGVRSVRNKRGLCRRGNRQPGGQLMTARVPHRTMCSCAIQHTQTNRQTTGQADRQANRDIPTMRGALDIECNTSTHVQLALGTPQPRRTRTQPSRPQNHARTHSNTHVMAFRECMLCVPALRAKDGGGMVRRGQGRTSPSAADVPVHSGFQQQRPRWLPELPQTPHASSCAVIHTQ
jgi:hypothetical protein